MTKALTYLTAALILAARAIRHAAARPHRCDGDLIAWETITANGRRVEMFRWL